ncbi:MAG: 2OG-Fe(II) oxygenase [Pseudomonadota bacterium]
MLDDTDAAPALAFDPETLSLSVEDARSAAKPYAAAYQSATPYNHGCVDGFMDPAILRRVKEEVETLPEAEASFSRAQENLKTSYNPDRLPMYTRAVFSALNAKPFLLFLEELTGIEKLIPDPYFAGAGIHRVGNGGHLDIHADFNYHGPLNLERRLNVLIYLNEDWREDWGGSFEIWDKAMTRKEASFVPVFNRMVCFSTGSDTFHGNPEPVNHPEGKPRMSIALYYYTATWDEGRKSHSTIFKPRPGTVDEADGRSKRRALIKDVLPPILYRRVQGPLRRIGF